MTDHRFETPEPITLYVSNQAGTVGVEATDTATTTVRLSGRDADQVTVRHDGDRVDVVAPRRRAGFLGGESALTMTITVPTGSALAVRSGSADVTASGRLGTTQVKSGSGTVTLPTLTAPGVVETGSGQVRIERSESGLQVKSGSGDVTLGEALGAVAISTGSGDVEIRDCHQPAVVKTGSGDLSVVECDADLSMSTGSGDTVIRTARRGRFTVKGASGDVEVGIPAGTPVWTDISTVTGRIASRVQGTGEPDPGAEHVELRAKTVSGDVVLNEI